MGVLAEKERAADAGLQPVFGDRLGNGQDVRFVETALEGRAVMAAGAEGDALSGCVR